MKTIKDDGDDRSDTVEHPRSTDSVHQRVDDGSHGVGLWSGELATGKAISLVEHDHHADHRSCADEGAKKLPSLLLARCGAQPVTDLQVGDETAGHAQRRADHTTHDECGEHAAGTTQSYGYHHHTGKDQRHQCHTAHRVTAHNGDGVGCHRGEEESDDGDEQDAHDGKEQIAVHHAQPEEEERDGDDGDAANSDDLERDVALRALHGRRGVALALHLFGSETNSTFDDSPALDDADDAGHGDAADADAAGVSLEDVLWTHAAHGSRNGRIPHVQHLVVESERHARHDQPPHGERAQADVERIFQSDDIAQAEHGGTCVHLEDELRLVSEHLSPADEAAREVLVPPAKAGHDEVVESAHDAGDEQWLGLTAALGTADEYLRRGSSLRERILAMHVADKVLAEGDEEKNAQHTAQS